MATVKDDLVPAAERSGARLQQEPLTSGDTSNNAAIEFMRVNKWFGNFHVLQDVSLTIRPGKVVVVCGPSGSGKSTFALAGAAAASRGGSFLDVAVPARTVLWVTEEPLTIIAQRAAAMQGDINQFVILPMQANPPEQLACRIPYGDAAIAERAAGVARDPDVAVDVAAQSVRSGRSVRCPRSPHRADA